MTQEHAARLALVVLRAAFLQAGGNGTPRIEHQNGRHGVAARGAPKLIASKSD
jgi:hypothetical protein